MSYYVTNENSVLNINNAHLKVSGNIQTDVMKLGAIEFAPPASDVPGTVNFTNVTTGVTTSSNLNVGGTLMLGSVELVTATAALEQTVNLGNVTSNTVQFTNATTGIVATGNVEASKFIGDGSLLTGITTIESNVDLIKNTDNTAFINLNSNVVVEFPRSKKLIKYPKVALTQNALNNGYTATSSTQESSSRAAWKVFNNAYAEGNGWRGTGTYSTSDGSFTGTWVDFSSGSQTISTSDRGDWLQIILPEKIRLEAVRLQPRYSPTSGGNPVSYGRSEFVKNGAIWGSNDGSSWGKVYTINSGLPGSDTSIVTFDGINSTTAYNYFVLVITDNHGSPTGTLASFSEWELFGTPEYDPEAHGTDVTVKSYPNVPNTDWLEVYYDAKGLDTGAVTTVNDLKPSSLGSAINSSSTNNITVADDAFVFNGTDSYIKINDLTNPSGAWVHSVVAWVKFTDFDSAQEVSWIGDADGTAIRQSFTFATGGETVTMGISGSNVQFRFTSPLSAGKWHHVVYTYNGGQAGSTSTAYQVLIDGVEAQQYGGVGTGTLTLPADSALWIGRNHNGANHFDGSITNFRLFNRALTSDEIYQLYAYQKEDFGHGDLSMTLKAGRLGIGTSEPRAMLDVRGDIFGRGIIQVQSTTFNGTASGTGTSFATLSGLTTSITPKRTGSKILVLLNLFWSGSNDAYFQGNVKKDGTVLVKQEGSVGSASKTSFGCFGSYNRGIYSLKNIGFSYLDDTNIGTEPIEYTIEVRNRALTAANYNDWWINYTSSTNDANRLTAVSTLTLIEIQQ
uniref:F5/8 type C domain-containing protein n=1 Tax=viral metagenome TaxID=1070528 RepID=A0A6C0CP91_9ZZZZ